MSGTSVLTVGNKGRVVIPVDVREHRSWHEGTTLIALETDTGLVLLSRDDARKIVRDQLSGVDLVAELIATRRAEAAADVA